MSNLRQVLDLDPLAVRDVTTMIARGLLRPGRPTPRGAYVYELTDEGEAALSRISDLSDVAEQLDIAEACVEGKCDHAEESKSLAEDAVEHEARMAAAWDVTLRLANAAAELSTTPKAIRDLIGELSAALRGEGDEP